jgi:hypothetical protein
MLALYAFLLTHLVPFPDQSAYRLGGDFWDA